MKHLMQIMRTLRSPEGCPWDRKQTYRTLRRCLLEEAYEVFEAIELRKKEKIQEELGDLLCVVFMLVAIGEERGDFSEKSVMTHARAKMVRRHPHVFGGAQVRTAQDAWKLWHEAKRGERTASSKRSVLDHLNFHAPALLLAHEMQKKAARVGFDWENAGQIFPKLEEEIQELKAEYRRGAKRKIREEMGDFLFAAVNLARRLGVDSEVALASANLKFKRRFQKMEALAQEKGIDLNRLTLKEIDRLWNQVKRTV